MSRYIFIFMLFITTGQTYLFAGSGTLFIYVDPSDVEDRDHLENMILEELSKGFDSYVLFIHTTSVPIITKDIKVIKKELGRWLNNNCSPNFSNDMDDLISLLAPMLQDGRGMSCTFFCDQLHVADNWKSINSLALSLNAVHAWKGNVTMYVEDHHTKKGLSLVNNFLNITIAKL